MNDKDLQQLLDETAAKLGVVGAQLSIYDGRTQRDFATGYRNRELELPVTTGTLFQIGSTTKVFNAALIMSLVDAGKLDLDTPVAEYIIDFQLDDAQAKQTMSLRHLLSMSAGLDNGPYYDYGRGDDALGRYVGMMGGVPLIFAPGSAYGYSNASTNVSGHAAARVMGRTWEHLLTERIWEPLGLKHSALFAEDLLLHAVAMGYKKKESGEGLERTPNWCLPRSIAPAGGLTCCSTGDLVRLGRMFLDRGKSASGVQVLSQAAVEVVQQPQVKLPTRQYADEWCIGPCRKKWGGHVLYGHGGTNLSGSSMLLWCPEKNVAIATLVNVAAQGYPLADAIFDQVLPRLFGIDKPKAPTPKSVTPIKTDFAPYVGRFEAHGMRYDFAVKNDKLMLHCAPEGLFPEVNCELIPLGDERFLPTDLAVSGNRNWDVAFWGRDGQGRATNFLQGVFPLRRTG